MHTRLHIVLKGQEQPTVIDRPLPHGSKGSFYTLGLLAEMVRHDAQSETVDRIVKGKIVRNARPHDKDEEIDHAFTFWQRGVQWRPDPIGIERIADFETTYELLYGDCCDKSEGLATSLACLGHTPYFVVISLLPFDRLSGDWLFSHVYVGVRIKGTHYALDPTPEDRPEGWESPATYRVGFRIFPEPGQPQLWVLP